MFKTLFEESATGTAIVSFDGKPVAVNRKFCEMLGYSEEELKTMVFTQFTHPDDIDIDWDLFQELRDDKRDKYKIEKRYVRKNKDILWVDLVVERLKKGDLFNYVVAYINDISERKHLAEELAETELLFEHIFDNMFQFIGQISTDGTLLKANKTALDFGGFTKEQAIGNKFYDAPWWTWNQEVREQLIESIKKASQGEFIRYFVDVMGKEGLRTIDFSLRPVKQNGKVAWLIPEGRLIPEEKELERELLETTLVLENTEKLAKTGGWSWTIALDKVELTTNAKELFGFRKDKTGISFEDIKGQIHPLDVQKFEETVAKALKEQKSYHQEYRVKKGSRSWRHIRTFGEPWFDANGKLESLHGALMDISDDIKASQQLEKVNKELTDTVDQLRQFTHITAHDLKEPLRSIKSFIQLFKQSITDIDIPAHVMGYMDFIESGSNRLNLLISDLLDYTKLETSQIRFEKVKIEEIITEALDDLSSQIDNSGTEVQFEGSPELVANKYRIRLLFQNLINNAIKFTKEGNSPKILITYESKRNHHQFNVIDNGIGIAKDKQAEIFNIFKRLHARDEVEGSGIGLSICKKIAEQHLGSIQVKSKPGMGSTFSFTLSKNLNENKT